MSSYSFILFSKSADETWNTKFNKEEKFDQKSTKKVERNDAAKKGPKKFNGKGSIKKFKINFQQKKSSTQKIQN